MDDKSFINLISDENLEKINIDPMLIDSFKRVMKKLQAYFNANGYTSERDYQAFFNENLLNDDSSKNLSFYLNDEPSKIGANGFYDGKRICIDKSRILDKDRIDHTLCHEFIHFLVMKNVINDKYADSTFKFGGFINEALTEMLTRQMYPDSGSYDPQVNMMDFANLLSDKENNYSLFLRGRIDARGYGGSSWNNFIKNVTLYQNKWNGTTFRLMDAINDEYYIQAQRDLIESKISPHLISSFEDYIEKIDILNRRPVADNEFMESLFNRIDENMIRNLSLKNEKLQMFMRKKLKEYREMVSSSAKYKNNDIYEFEIAGHKIAIDKNRQLYGTTGISYSASWNPNTSIYEIKIDNESIKLNINKIDFKKWQNDSLKRQDVIAKYFSKTAKDDVKAVSQVARTEGLIKLERFDIPPINSGGNKKSNHVYVATYNDSIEILNNLYQVGVMENVNQAQYVGVTSLDPKNSAIYMNTLGKIKRGYVYSCFNQKYLQKQSINLLKRKIMPTLSKEEISQIIENYKQSSEYDEEDELTKEELQDFAINFFAKNRYYELLEDDRQNIFDTVVNSNQKYFVSVEDGKIDVSLLFGDKIVTAFRSNAETLINTKGNGLYNEQYDILVKDREIGQEKESSKIPIDDDGNMMFSSSKRNKILDYQEKLKKSVNNTNFEEQKLEYNMDVSRKL